jgi:hypothetical protein
VLRLVSLRRARRQVRPPLALPELLAQEPAPGARRGDLAAVGRAGPEPADPSHEEARSVSESTIVWRKHEIWPERRAHVRLKRERWTDADWEAAKQLAVSAWEEPHGSQYERLFVFVAQEALFEHHCRRVEARLALEASHDAAWLLAVLDRTT